MVVSRQLKTVAVKLLLLSSLSARLTYTREAQNDVPDDIRWRVHGVGCPPDNGRTDRALHVHTLILSMSESQKVAYKKPAHS